MCRPESKQVRKRWWCVCARVWGGREKDGGREGLLWRRGPSRGDREAAN